jgi:eukaryotic-like serine/threonine-protein kinase
MRSTWHTNREAWKVDAGSEVRSSPFIVNEIIYFGNEVGDFFALDYRGNIKWRFKAKRNITSSPCVTQRCCLLSPL